MKPGTGIPIRGMGVISALGTGRPANVQSMRAKRDGLAPLTLFPHPGMEHVPACSVSEFPADRERRCDELAMVAIEEALEDAGLVLGSPELEECALLLGNTSVDLLEFESRSRLHLQRGTGFAPFLRQGAILGTLADRLADRVGIGGPVLAYNTSCSASANALHQGMQLLWTGRVQRVLVVGVDSLTATSYYGFTALALLDPDGCRPFDRDRKGIQLGEGAAAVLLDRDVAPRPSGTSQDSVLLAGVNVFDAHHPTASSPDGSAGAVAMQSALRRSGVETGRIVGVKSHGTGSSSNDLAEARALSRVFGEAVPPFTSLKRYVGHTMGASGILELVLFLGCIRDGFIPATLGFATNDPEFEAAPLEDHRTTDGGVFLFNSFGFGGSCVSLVLEV